MNADGKSMWKILFNFVNVNSNDLNSHTFHLVEDILCKDPSLICFQTQSEFEYSDVLLCWLINKLIANLTSNSLQHKSKNFVLQKGIVYACLKSRPALFSHLTLCYANVINQIAQSMEQLQDKRVPNADQEEIHIIFGSCITANDPDVQEMSFTTTTIDLRKAEALLPYLLKILTEAISVGYEVYPDLPPMCLSPVLKAFRECGFSNKILCLKYFYIYVEKMECMGYVEEFCILEILSAEASLWEILPLCLTFDCSYKGNIIEISEITTAITTKMQSLIDSHDLSMRLLNSTVLVENAFSTLLSIIEIAKACPNSNDIFTLLEAYTELIFCFQIKIGGKFHFSLQECEILQTKTVDYPIIFRLLAGALVQNCCDGSVHASNLKYMHQEFLCVIKEYKNLPNVHTRLFEILACFLFIQNNWKSRKEVGTTLELQFNVNLLRNFVAEMISNEDFVNNSYQVYIKIATLLLDIDFIRESLTPGSIRKLIEFTLRPFERFVQSLSINENISCVEKYDLHASIMSLRKLNSKKIGTCMADVKRSICEYIEKILKNENFGHVMTVKFWIGQTLPHLVFEKLCSKELVVSFLPQNISLCVFPLLLKSICAPCSAGVLSPYVAEPFSYAKFMCSWKRWNSDCSAADNFSINMLNLQNNVKIFIYESTLSNDNYFCFAKYLSKNDISPKESLKIMRSLSNALVVNVEFLRLLMSKCLSGKELFKDMIQVLLSLLTDALSTDINFSKLKQLNLLRIFKCGFDICEVEDDWSFYFFKMSIVLVLHPQSCVAHEAIIFINEMCQTHHLYPMQLWNWHKKESLHLVIKLTILVYVQKGVRCSNSLMQITKMLGFSCVQEFICKYYRLMLTLLVPYCVKEPTIRGLIVGISKATQKTVRGLLRNSFFRIYTYVFTNEIPVAQQCVDMITAATCLDLNELLNANIKQTVFEFLVHFHRNADFVKETFQVVYSQELEGLEHSSSNSFSSFIAERFLGIITYFESCLGDQNIEKQIKEAALCSFSELIKFVGTEHVTKYRFKIIAMLEFVTGLNDGCLQSICLKIWNIFLHVVNIQEIGPSLSHIVAALQQHLSRNELEVNNIYKFLILKHGDLFEAYLPELYFLEDVETVALSVRQLIKNHVDKAFKDKSDILEELSFLCNRISSSNVQIRINGLRRLEEFITNHRMDLNQQILNVIIVDATLENMTNTLVLCCRHEDSKLQLAAAKCLGELGAVDPSYLMSTYSCERSSQITFGVHTDQFTVMALQELCRAYQSQKGTKHVDNFSIAIQETLSASGISLVEKKKVEVWESMPLSMRQIMTPFLTSCYTVSRRGAECRSHPIFNSSTCKNFTNWAFTWATRLIDNIKATDTKHLLNSYKPSIRRDYGILTLFFPYILVHSLQDCTDSELQAIFEEFDAVFMSCQQASVKQQTTNSPVLKEFYSSKYTNTLKRSDSDLKSESVSAENVALKCSKLCSELIDFLRRWIYEWERTNDINQHTKEARGTFDRVSKFVGRFNKLKLAKSNFNTNEFARSLIFLEEYILEDLDNRLQDEISFLMQIHYQLDDVDSTAGCINVKRSNLSLSEQILYNLMIDRPHEAMNCYEQLMSLESNQIIQENIKGMINCYLSMETPETALLIADGLWQKFSESYSDEYFKDCKLELYWRLGRYKPLQDMIEENSINCSETNWSAQCAQAFLLFRQPVESTVESDLNSWLDELDKIRGKVLSTMRNSFTSKRFFIYPYSYHETVKLHLITEVEKTKLLVVKLFDYCSVEGSVTLLETNCLSEIQKFLTEWELRLNIVQPMARVIGPILTFRRNLLLEAKQFTDTMAFKTDSLRNKINSLINTEIGKLWMMNAQIYREGGNLQQAHISLLKAEQYAPKVLFIEKAKLFWKMGNQRESFKMIEENLEQLNAKCDGNLRSLPDDERILYAEAKLLQAKYSADSMNICADLNLRYFKEAIVLNKNSEKCQVNLAHYMEKIYNSYSENQKNSDNGRKFMLEIMLTYARSLRCGVENVYQSLPRLLTLWLDYTTNCNATNQPRSSGSTIDLSKPILPEDLARKMNDLIMNCSNMLPTPIFYTAFSQMLSRIGHPSEDVFSVLRTIIIKLVQLYPHQSLWKLLPVFKSFNTHRMKRCKLIITDTRLGDAAFQKILIDFNMLTERLIELTNKDTMPDNVYDLNTLVKQLPKLFENKNFTQILLPFEKFMQISFPIAPSFCSDVFSANSQTSIPTNPFPHKQVFICGIKKEIIVLRSAARPKKVTLRCNDGQEYAVMVKPKDDLRRDFRLMEFNDLVKRYLHLDYTARNRHLRIRTYSVVPFNEECGLLEWLPNLNSFRSICTSFYRKRNLGMADRHLRQFALPKSDPIESKRRVFLNELLPKHPPVFHEWFLRQFPTPHVWFEARTSYVKTIAVMSIVGYILGLGDRHGENILFDETNGDAVHVDFNCLFNLGESFAFPELVPFRLTHNMTFAMGPLKVDGLFRRTCEITLRILKHASTTLMSVLRPFVYDLVVFNRNLHKQREVELTDPKAMMDVRRIDERLQGFIKKTTITSMPLSVEGQVNLLIDEATSIDNLASMYIGWGAYL